MCIVYLQSQSSLFANCNTRVVELTKASEACHPKSISTLTVVDDDDDDDVTIGHSQLVPKCVVCVHKQCGRCNYLWEYLK